MSEEGEKPNVLPSIPEPVLTADERAALAEVYRDPAFWEAFEQMPEPPAPLDPTPPTA